MRHTNISAFFIILTSLILTSCSKNNENIFSGNAFGTIYYININDNYNNDPIQIKSTIEEIIYNINNSASSYNKNSEISVFNFSNNTSYKLISSNLYNIIFKANKVSNLTNGYFDITIGDIKIKKGFYINQHKFIKEEPRNFNYEDITLSEKNRSIKKNYKNINIDLSGIAKGYAVDLIYNYLLSKNINNFFINIGGEIKVHNSQESIKVAIDDPTGKKQFTEEVFLQNKSIATSGTYKDTVNYKGKEISHIVNPKTLKNISNLKLLVSVIHDECAIADALATGLIAMDTKDIINFSNTNNIASMLILFGENKLEKHYSSEFIKYLTE